jgi:hypothetical protein
MAWTTCATCNASEPFGTMNATCGLGADAPASKAFALATPRAGIGMSFK